MWRYVKCRWWSEVVRIAKGHRNLSDADARESTIMVIYALMNGSYMSFAMLEIIEKRHETRTTYLCTINLMMIFFPDDLLNSYFALSSIQVDSLFCLKLTVFRCAYRISIKRISDSPSIHLWDFPSVGPSVCYVKIANMLQNKVKSTKCHYCNTKGTNHKIKWKRYQKDWSIE